MVAGIGLEAIFETAQFANGLREYLDGIKDAEGKTGGAATKIQAGMAAIGGTIVTTALAGATLAIGAVTAAATASVPAFLNWAGTVDSMGDVLGTNAEESSALAVAIQSVGGNVEGITGQMAYLTKGLVDAEGKIGPTGEVMKGLGIDFLDAEGNILPATDILTKVSDHLSTMPDGLEKTTLMTRLFGKSGKDLTDTLNALTTEGFAEASELAKELGLSLSDDAVSGSVELQKKFETLKMVGQGLMVNLGEELAPAVSELTDEFMGLVKKALPKVRELLPKIAEIVMSIASFIIENIPKVFAIISDVFNFLINNKPLIIGVLAAIAAAVAVWAYTTISALIPALVATMTTLAPAIAVIAAIGLVVAAVAWAWENNFLGMRDVITQFWDDKVKPLLQELWNWLQINIPIAIQTVSDFWQNVLLPAILEVFDWIQANVFPILQDLWNWLEVNIPIALQTLSNFWTTVLWPALQNVWNWVQTVAFPIIQDLWNWLQVNVPAAIQTLTDYWTDVIWPAMQDVWAWMQDILFPFLESIANFLTEVFGLAVQELSDLWSETLLPALQEVWSWVSEKLFPALEELGDWLSEKLGPIMSAAATKIRETLGAAFEWATEQLQSLTNWFNNLASWINGLGDGGGGGGGGGGSGAGANDDSGDNGSSIVDNNGSGGKSGKEGIATSSRFVRSPSTTSSSVTNNINLGNNSFSSAVDGAAFEARVRQTVETVLKDK